MSSAFIVACGGMNLGLKFCQCARYDGREVIREW